MAPLRQAPEHEGTRRPVLVGQGGERRLEQGACLGVRFRPGRQHAAVPEGGLGHQVGAPHARGDVEGVEEALVRLTRASAPHAGGADGEQQAAALDLLPGAVVGDDLEGAGQVVGSRFVGHALQRVLRRDVQVAQRVLGATAAGTEEEVDGELPGMSRCVRAVARRQRLAHAPVHARPAAQAQVLVQRLPDHGVGEAVRVEGAPALVHDGGGARLVERGEQRLLVAVDDAAHGGDVELLAHHRRRCQDAHAHS